MPGTDFLEVDRSIPAWAGEPEPKAVNADGIRVDPRVGGGARPPEPNKVRL